MSLVINQVSLASAVKLPLLESVDHRFDNGVTALVGSNGVGKSTLLRAMATVHPLTAGTVCLDQFDSRLNMLSYLDRLMFMPQTFAAYPDLTGSEFLEYSLCLRGSGIKQARIIAGGWLERVDLAHAGKAKVMTYSQGMLQRLGLAYTFQVQASAYLLDEPFAGVDPESRSSLIKLLVQIAQTAVIIVSTHHFDEIKPYGVQVVRIQERTFVYQ